MENHSFLTLENIRMRAVEPDDALTMWEMECDSTQWIHCGMSAPFSHHNLFEYANGYDADPFRAGQLRLVVESSGNIAGLVDLYSISAINRTAFVGIYILPEFRMNHAAAKCLKLLEEYALMVLNLRVLAAKIHSENFISERLFLSAGFKQCGLIPDWILTGGKASSLKLFYKILSNG
ncbi:MAG: GNAT family N-acetyltransferase [Candidatus Amulumruptor caecigallinarius]|nr:GNAT family N-acetyltransferase [Candidatus Amulumruptor caecigallinarius]